MTPFFPLKERETVLSKDFPAKLRALRVSRGWSQGQLAKKIGADLQRVSKYERGVMWPTMELMVRIAAAFEVSVDHLIRDTENVFLERIKSKALLQQMEEIGMLPEKDQEVVVSFLDAFIKRRKFEELMRG